MQRLVEVDGKVRSPVFVEGFAAVFRLFCSCSACPPVVRNTKMVAGGGGAARVGLGFGCGRAAARLSKI